MVKRIFSVLTLAAFVALISFDIAHAMTTVEFFQLAGRHRHIQPFAVTVQSACETGHWSSDLWNNGYNGAGLKVSSEWLNAGKPYISKYSIESRNGVYGKENSKFRKYISPGEFLKDYEKKFGRTIQDAPETTTIYGDISQDFMQAGSENGPLTTNIMKN